MRNLVLLLNSGHTVRVALRDDDLSEAINVGWDELRAFIAVLPAAVAYDEESLIFAYIEDPSLPDFLPGGGMEREPLNDYQRISAEGAGTVVQYG